jgi:spore maturation protein CgeB
MKITIIGLTISSSWGNGHATTYRGLVKELHKSGHEILFLEQDVPWYAGNRDLINPDYCKIKFYNHIEDLKHGYTEHIKDADLVMVGSYVMRGTEVGEWVCKTAKGVKAFYDIDTPVTLARLQENDYLYLSHKLIPQYDIYFSFTGGPVLEKLEKVYGSPMARALYCSFDPDMYYPMPACEKKWDLGYLGTYSEDRQPPLESLMLKAAQNMEEKKFIVAGPQYPYGIRWPHNIERVDHIAPEFHCNFYNSQRFTLNITRQDMIKAGYSPSVRLFEAAACGVPIISDYWQGIETFFEPEMEILISKNSAETQKYLKELTEEEIRSIGMRAKAKVMEKHTASHRAAELESAVKLLINVEV